MDAGPTGAAQSPLDPGGFPARTERMDKLNVTPLEKLVVPMGGQEIELQQIDYAVGGMSLLRTRIREGKRFTIFDVDPATARAWGEALCAWAAAQDARAAGVPEGEPR